MKLSYLLFPALALIPALSSAAPIVWGVNDHAYDMITLSTGMPTYTEAKALAESSSYLGVQGRLLVLETPNYAAELSFVHDSVIVPNSPAANYWIGVTRPDTTGNARENWTWNDGSTVPNAITNGWNIDFNEGAGVYAGSLYVQDNFSTVWDYRQDEPLAFTGGYIVEYAAPVPEPATMAALGFGAVALFRRRRKA